MATKSDNTKGNPYHDESTGEFTSAEGSGIKKTETQQTDGSSNPLAKRLKFKLSEKSLGAIKQGLEKIHQVSSIPVLGSGLDIEEHIEQFFPEEVVKKIDSYFGKFNIPYKYFNLRTDPNQRCGVNIFAACIGKKRWKNNYIRLIDETEYKRILNDRNYQALFRGLRGSDKEFQIISDSYSSIENDMIYGSVGGTAYGIGVYASSVRGEAISYAGYNSDHVMYLALNKNAVTMPYNKICRIKDEIAARKTTILPKVEQIFLKNGIEPSRAKQMASSFGITLDDEGFVAMLCGVEWYTDYGTYHIIQNLGQLFRFRKP